MARLELLGTSDCQLCDEAEYLLFTQLNCHGLRAWRIDISAGDNADALIELYGLRIPVLRFVADGESDAVSSLAHADDELAWPFTAAQISQFLQHHHLI